MRGVHQAPGIFTWPGGRSRRAVASDPELRIIYTSGVCGSAELGRSPPGRFLAKPYSPGRLVIAVADALAD